VLASGGSLGSFRHFFVAAAERGGRCLGSFCIFVVGTEPTAGLGSFLHLLLQGQNLAANLGSFRNFLSAGKGVAEGLLAHARRGWHFLGSGPDAVSAASFLRRLLREAESFAGHLGRMRKG